MPRIRTIVPEFWEDERFSNVSLPACLLYIGMKNFADDSGVILANANNDASNTNANVGSRLEI